MGLLSGLKVKTTRTGSFKKAINQAGWLDEEVLAAGHLRQGSTSRGKWGGLAQPWEAIQLMLPSRSEKLPRHFVLAVTASEVVAFRATEVSSQSGSAYVELKIREGVRARYPRASVTLTGLEKGATSFGGTITIDGDSFPVMRPNVGGDDPNTDELIAKLARLPSFRVRVDFLPAGLGDPGHPKESGYRQPCWFGETKDNGEQQWRDCYFEFLPGLGAYELEGTVWVDRGSSAEALLTPMKSPTFAPAPGTRFELWDRAVIATGEVLQG
jgi:hypothetical protein